MSEEHNMTITEIISLADAEGFDVYKGVIVLSSAERGFEVQHDYGNANVSYWETHEEARQEAARLWLAGEASHIEDFVVKEVGEKIAARHEEFDRRLNAAAVQINAELRAA